MKKRIILVNLFSIVLFLNLFGFIINEFFKVFDLPLFLSPLKSLLTLIGIFLIPHDRKSKIAIILLICFSLVYLIIGIIQNRVYPAFYFLRIYIEPLLFFCYVYLLLKNYEVYVRTIKVIIRNSFLFSILGVITFFLINYTSFFDFFKENESFLNNDWNITYTNIIRNGIVVGGPNNAGFILLGLLGLVIIKHENVKSLIGNHRLFILILLLLINLILTFSKSAIGGFFIFIIIYQLKSLNLLKSLIILFLMSVIIALLLSFLPDDQYSSISYWFNSIIRLNDSSSINHINSFNKGVEILKDNWFLGSEKGTFGQKAMRFPEFVRNIESSVIIMTIDLGLVGLLLYLGFIILLTIDDFKINLNIILFILLISVPLIVLPMIQEIEAMLIVYSIIPFILYKNKYPEKMIQK